MAYMLFIRLTSGKMLCWSGKSKVKILSVRLPYWEQLWAWRLHDGSGWCAGHMPIKGWAEIPEPELATMLAREINEETVIGAEFVGIV